MVILPSCLGVRQVKPQTDQRLSDRISIGLLTLVLPPEIGDPVVAE